MASRTVLIKAVLNSMPLYLFSILAAPKWVLKEIRNLQRNFLRGGAGQNRKWALLKWEKVCIPKSAGGIGIRDPENINKEMGAKIWWRWLDCPQTPWARLWNAKYASNCPLEERIRMTEISIGSAIWNSENQHRTLIQNYSFWELKNGAAARFWTDSWQQLPKLCDIFQDQPINMEEVNESATTNQYWTIATMQEMRIWKPGDQILPNNSPHVQNLLELELKKKGK